MELILLAIILLQFSYMVYLDLQNRAERELLQLKLMSKDLGDYLSGTEEVEDSPEPKDDPYVDMSEVSVDQLLKAKEK